MGFAVLLGFSACSSPKRDYVETEPQGGAAGQGGATAQGGTAGKGGTAGRGGTAGQDGENGGESGSGTSGSGGAPPTLKQQGEACTEDDDCQSASCRTGFCCDTVCDGSCEACAEASTGSADGTCAPVLAGADPECDETSLTPCNEDDDCGADEYCPGETCAKKQSSGHDCGGDNECSSAACRDGVCCESSCDLDCQACSNETTSLANGKCGPRVESATQACPSDAPTSCVDLEFDLSNCGECGHDCPTPSLAGAIRTCTSGECGFACPPGTLGDGTNVCIPVSTIAAGNKFTCGLLSSGKVSCWGDTSDGIAPGPAGVGDYVFTSLSAQYNVVCGLRDTGQIVCWGASPSTHNGPYIALSTGEYHVCAIKANQTLECWSSDDDTVIETEPSGKYKGIASMNHYSCALISGGADDGKLQCWGDSPNYDFRAPPTNTVFTRIIGGANHGCAIKPDKTIVCYGLLYYPEFPASTAFKALGNGGATHYCGILSDDTIFCWGSDGGVGGPAASEPAGSFTSVVLGSNHTCGVTSANRVVCAGDNAYGQSANQPGPFLSW